MSNFKLFIKCAITSIVSCLLTLWIIAAVVAYEKAKDEIPLPCFVIESGARQFLADVYTLESGCVRYSMENSPDKVCCGNCAVIPFPRSVCDAALFEMTKSQLPEKVND